MRKNPIAFRGEKFEENLGERPRGDDLKDREEALSSIDVRLSLTSYSIFHD